MSESKSIAFKDIRVGDIIEIIDRKTVTVKDVDPNWVNGAVYATRPEWDRTFHLVERLMPGLPTEFGSVIEVAGERWMLRPSSIHDVGFWVCGQREHTHSPVAMTQHVLDVGGFEVLL